LRADTAIEVDVMNTTSFFIATTTETVLGAGNCNTRGGAR
jgi:hypothetical protein